STLVLRISAHTPHLLLREYGAIACEYWQPFFLQVDDDVDFLSTTDNQASVVSTKTRKVSLLSRCFRCIHLARGADDYRERFSPRHGFPPDTQDRRPTGYRKSARVRITLARARREGARVFWSDATSRHSE